MSETKKIEVKLFLKIILIIPAVIILIGLSLFGYYYFTKESVDRYITKNYTCYVKINSLSLVYNNLIELKAADVILSQGSLKNIYKILLDIRNSKLATNRIISSLLNMKANLIINKDYSSSLLIDIGFKSMLLRVSNLNPEFVIKLLGTQDVFSIRSIKHDKYNILEFNLKKSGQVFYVSINKNLLFIGLKQSDIESIYNTKKSGESISNDPSFYSIKNQVSSGSMANIYFNTGDMINSFTSNLTGLQHIFSKLKFNDNSAVSLNISNENISLNTFTRCSSEDDKLNKFLSKSPSRTDIITYLPPETSLCASINFDSFEELYKLLLYIEEGKFDKTITNIDNASKLVFKIGIDELLFSWIGREIGTFYANDVNNPVIFIKIKDRKKLDFAFDAIFASILADQDKALVYDDVELKKIKFPDFIRSVISSFTSKYIDAPYYKILDDYIFFCMDPVSLANMVRKKEHNVVLYKDATYQKISSKVDANSNIFLYFNSSERLPLIFNSNPMLASIIKLYEKGVMTINLNQSTLKIDLNAAGINVKKITTYPGFPKKIDQTITSNIICKNITGTGVNELVFTTNDNKLNALDINMNNINNFPAKFNNNNEFDPIVEDVDSDGMKEIYIFTDNGDLYKFDAFGNIIEGYPFNTECKSSFNPVRLNKMLLLYSKTKNRLVAFDKDKNSQTLNFEFKNNLIYPPTVFDDIIAFYPKNITGTIYVTNTSGDLLSGWPKEASGVGYGSPVIADIKQYGINNIIFLTQSGKLNVWKFDGNTEANFPLQLDGVYYCQPVAGNIIKSGNNEIAALNKDGQVTIINSDGSIAMKKQIKDADSKDRQIMLFDINSDGLQEILLYAGKDSIIALDGKLNIIPGFPVKGITKPGFTDFNSDGDIEMVTSSLDNNIWIYSIPR
jgi:hypothetical protein